MAQTLLATWHELVRTRNAEGLSALLADDVVFHSPVVHTPQVGKARINGVDLFKWNDEGRIVELKVLIRPLKAINLIHQKMAARLQASS